MPVAAQKSRVLVGDFNMSLYTQNVSTPISVDTLDVSVLTSTAKEYIAGQVTSTFALSGVYSVAENTDLAAWYTAAAQPLTYGPSGFSIGSEVWMLNGIETTFAPSSSVSDAVKFELAAQADGITDYGVSLHDLGAETADGNATSVDGGAQSTTGAVAHLHVTAYSGLTNAVITVADSADNSSFATIGTFATVTGVTTERLVIAGTVRRYVRATVDVTGTGSVTYMVGFARR